MKDTITMQNIEYLEDVRNHFLLAYERSTEFFVIYLPEKQRWEDCQISFLRFKHDYEYSKISREEVVKRTGGILPESNFENYLAIIRGNRGEVSQP